MSCYLQAVSKLDLSEIWYLNLFKRAMSTRIARSFCLCLAHGAKRFFVEITKGSIEVLMTDRQNIFIGPIIVGMMLVKHSISLSAL